jgi:hypothetical protein
MFARIFLVIFFSGAVIVSKCAAVESARGIQTTLEYTFVNTPSPLHLNQSISKTTFILQSIPHSEIVLSTELEGKWFCLGYNAAKHFYVIGGISQKGAWLPLASIRYFPENGGEILSSAFDLAGYHALSAVSSPSGRYIVFIGGRLTIDGLYVLDVERNLVRKLGSAPLPPPNSYLNDICSGKPFEWGGCWADRYLELDSGIIVFKSETELEVKYGKDGPSARSKKRRINRFRLDG